MDLFVDQRLGKFGRQRPHANDRYRFFTPSTLIDLETHRSPYRFTYLYQKAIEAANEVKSLGQSLLSAIEKADAEHLAFLRGNSEQQISKMTTEHRKQQWEESETQWRVLKQNRSNTVFRKRFYEELINGGLNGGERSHLNLMSTAGDLTLVAQVIELGAQLISLIPDLTAGGAGISSPVAISKLTGGQKISRMMEFVARALHTYSGKLQGDAAQELTKAGYARRKREWQHQRDTAKHEIIWLERQIDAARQRMTLAQNELNIQQQQMEFSQRSFAFLQNKLSNSELYDLLRDETLMIFDRAWDFALETAKQAEVAFRMERHFDSDSYVGDISQNSGGSKFLAGDRLISSLRRMEKKYRVDNARENELTQHFSLRLHSPTSLVALRTTGICEFEIPEWIFDLQYPGHLLRRIKSVSLSLPCVLGPYQTVNCTLTQLGSAIRHNPEVGFGYEEVRSSEVDPRFVRSHAVGQSIATTGGQNDNGMFQMNFQDERLLPFEGMGVISRWRIELPHETNWFDIETLTDAVLHIQYTSKDAGQPLRDHAYRWAVTQLPSKDKPSQRIIDLRHDLPAGLEQLNLQGDCCLPLPNLLSFPWRNGSRSVSLGSIEFLAIVKGATDAPINLKIAGVGEIALYPTPGFNGRFRGIMTLPGEANCLDLSIEKPNGVAFEDLFVQVNYFYGDNCE